MRGKKMEKIIIRSNVSGRGTVNSAFIRLTDGKTYKSADKLIADYGYPVLMRTLYREIWDSETLETSALYREYLTMSRQSETEDGLHTSDDFMSAYRVHERFAVFLDRNIYLYHLIPKDESYTKIIPWYYADSRSYIGDTWWYDDEEILSDIKKLNVLEFLMKYKGY